MSEGESGQESRILEMSVTLIRKAVSTDGNQTKHLHSVKNLLNFHPKLIWDVILKHKQSINFLLKKHCLPSSQGSALPVLAKMGSKKGQNTPRKGDPAILPGPTRNRKVPEIL